MTILRMMILKPAAFLGMACLAACGGPRSDALHDVEVAPSTQALTVTLSPVVDTSDLPEALRESISVERLSVHIATARLLGSDPGIPAGGIDLLPFDQTLDDDKISKVELSIATHFLDDPDLAIFVRLEPDSTLDDASFVIEGLHYARALSDVDDSSDDEEVDDETSDPVDATDPDGDPAINPDLGSGATDPDGDPALDPEPTEPEPTIGSSSSGLASVNAESFEIRELRPIDLTVSLDGARRSELTLRVPLGPWLKLNPEWGLEVLDETSADDSSGLILTYD